MYAARGAHLRTARAEDEEPEPERELEGEERPERRRSLSASSTAHKGLLCLLLCQTASPQYASWSLPQRRFL